MPHHHDDDMAGDDWHGLPSPLLIPTSSSTPSSSISMIGGAGGVYATQTLVWISFALYGISLLWALRKCYDRCRTDAAQRRWHSAIVSSSSTLLTPSGSAPSLGTYLQSSCQFNPS
jgi:hypothetical protein